MISAISQVSHTDHAVWSLYCLCFAVKLVPETLYVIEAIGNDNVVSRQHSLHGRVFFRSGVLLGFGSMVDIAGDAKRLIVDEMDSQSGDACIGACAGDLGLEVFL